MAPKSKPLEAARPPSKPSASSDSSDEGETDSDYSSPHPSSEPKYILKKSADDVKSALHNRSKSDEESSGSSESDDIQSPTTERKSPNSISIATQKVAQQSSETDASETGSESESEPEETVKQSQSPETPVTKKVNTSKRSEMSFNETQKVLKKKRLDSPISEKKVTNDEITILERVLAYKNNGMDPFGDLKGFHKSIKNDIDSAIGLNELQGILKQMKHNYQINERNVEKGKGLHFNPGWKRNVYVLSKAIWGSSSSKAADLKIANKESPESSMSRQGSEENEDNEDMDICNGNHDTGVIEECHLAQPVPNASKLENGNLRSNRSSNHLALEASLLSDVGQGVAVGGFNMLREGLGLVDPSKLHMFEQEWLEVWIATADARMKHHAFIKKQLSEILQAMRESG